MTNSSAGCVFVLGANDPEMQLIENLLRERGEEVAYAMVDGKRVHPGNAYSADFLPISHYPQNEMIFVECECWQLRLAPHIDHHRPGDPGYGKPASEFLSASSVGQVYARLNAGLPYVLGGDGQWYIDNGSGYPEWLVPREVVLAAAADHCLGAAYRGECPGVKPDELMRWRIATRAKFQNLSENELLARVEAARQKIRQFVAETSSVAAVAVIFDARGEVIPELPEAAVREGVAYIATVKDRGGREKVVLGSASPEQVQYFLDHYPAVEKYGDPARGLAGGYVR